MMGRNLSKFLKKRKVYYICFLFSFCLLISWKAINHNPKRAALTALNFSEAAIINKDFTKAADLVQDNSSKDINSSKIKKIIISIHPDDKYPKTIETVEYEPVPGTAKIKIYLNGLGENGEKFYYCFVLVLDEKEEYKVSEIYRKRGDIPFPQSKLRRPL